VVGGTTIIIMIKEEIIAKLAVAAAIIIIVTQAGGGCRKSYASERVSKVDTSLIYYKNHAEVKQKRFTF
jgi:hypothetical protein